MRQHYTILAIFWTLHCFCQTDTASKRIFSDYAIVIPDTSHWTYKLKHGASVILTHKEYLQIDSILKICIRDNGQTSPPRRYGNRIGNSEYVKQLVPFKNDNDEKVVGVNCICRSEIETSEKVKRKRKELIALGTTAGKKEFLNTMTVAIAFGV